MKFKEYLESLNKLMAERPEVAEMDVIYSIDDEGNGFQEVSCDGTVGYFDRTYGGDFYPEDMLEEEEIEHQANSVCIN